MLTIITVNYNSKIDLEKTLTTIGEQVGNNSVEVIVIDGNSTDGSQDLVEKQFGHIVNVLVSEPDKGIYDAMNKGVKLAKYDWIYFLNAGDCFAADDVLCKIIDVLGKNNDKNFIYAPYISDGKVNYEQNLSMQYLGSHMINHQSILFNKILFTNHTYNISYRYCADYAHLLMTFNKINAIKVEFVIANYDSSGISSSENNKLKMWRERLRAIYESNLSVKEKMILSKRGLIAYPYHFVKELMSFNENIKK